MTTNRFVWVLVSFLVGWTSSAKADLFFYVDVDRAAQGIQNTREVTSGEVFDADIWLEITNGTSIDLYGVSIAFDNTELSFDVTRSFETPIDNFFSFRILSMNSEGNSIDGIEAGTPITAIGTGPTAGANASTAFLIATLQFTAINPIGGVTDLDIGFEEGVFDGSFDNSFNPLLPHFIGASIITAVPEPSSIALLLSTLVILGLVRRKFCKRSVARFSEP